MRFLVNQSPLVRMGHDSPLNQSHIAVCALCIDAYMVKSIKMVYMTLALQYKMHVIQHRLSI